MNKCNYVHRVLAYSAAMLQAEKMRELGLVSAKEYAEIDTIIAKKYGISSCSIYRRNSWISRVSQVNMSHTVEVT